MIQFIGILIRLFLIGIISLRIPTEYVGLASFATESNFLGSPRSATRWLNISTLVGILIYFAIAVELNLRNT